MGAVGTLTCLVQEREFLHRLTPWRECCGNPPGPNPGLPYLPHQRTPLARSFLEIRRIRSQVSNSHLLATRHLLPDTYHGMPRKLLFLQLPIVAALAVLHFLALTFSLYWYFPWFDLLTHFLGGMWAGVFLLWSHAQAGYAPQPLFVVAGALAVGVLWEIFEVTAGIPLEANYVFDTSLDLLTDVFGSLCALGIAWMMRPHLSADRWYTSPQ